MGYHLINGSALTLNVLYHTIPHELCKCQVKDVHGLQSFFLTHSKVTKVARTNDFKICIFEREFSYFFRGVCLVV